MSDLARATYEAAMRALVGNIRATAAAFLCAEAAATAAEGAEPEHHDAFEHAILDESRAAFAPVLERCAGALQMLGIDVPPHEKKG